MESRLNQIEGRWVITDSYYELNGQKEARMDFEGIEFTFKADKSFNGIGLIISNDYYTNKPIIEKIPSSGSYEISDDGKTLTVINRNGWAFSSKIETLNKKKLVLRQKSDNRDLVDIYTKK